MNYVDSLSKILQLCGLVFAATIAVIFLAFPETYRKFLDAHAARMGTVVSEINSKGTAVYKVHAEDENIVLTGSEISDAVVATQSIDLIREKYPCIFTADCTGIQQQEIASELNLGPSSFGSTSNIKEWVVVFGADRDLEEASHEIRNVRILTNETGVFLRDGWFRSVAFYDTQNQAKESLQGFSEVLNRDGAYVRALANWCASLEEIDGEENSFSCGTNN